MWRQLWAFTRGPLLCGATVLITSTGRLTAQTAIPRPDHVVIVIEENRRFDRILDSSTVPYINTLIQRGAYMSEYFALTHPSEPNYLGLFSGSPQGVSDDSCPHTFDKPNLGAELLDAGFTFAAFSESLPSVGSRESGKGEAGI